MIHEGQEFARSKVIFPQENIPDNNNGMMDHNSYEKDNPTNYINYSHVQLNKELHDYYKGLIALRNKYESFKNADYESIKFLDAADNPFALWYSIEFSRENFIVLFNANPEKQQSIFYTGR